MFGAMWHGAPAAIPAVLTWRRVGGFLVEHLGWKWWVMGMLFVLLQWVASNTRTCTLCPALAGLYLTACCDVVLALGSPQYHPALRSALVVEQPRRRCNSACTRYSAIARKQGLQSLATSPNPRSQHLVQMPFKPLCPGDCCERLGAASESKRCRRADSLSRLAWRGSGSPP